MMESNDWDLIIQTTNVHDAWTLFSEWLDKAVKICVSMRNRRPAKKSKPNWWNSDIKRCLTE